MRKYKIFQNANIHWNFSKKDLQSFHKHYIINLLEK